MWKLKPMKKPAPLPKNFSIVIRILNLRLMLIPALSIPLIQEVLESGKHIINDEIVPPLDECFEPGRSVNDIMALNP